jgi:hypothetical protein
MGFNSTATAVTPKDFRAKRFGLNPLAFFTKRLELNMSQLWRNADRFPASARAGVATLLQPAHPNDER